MSSNIQLSFSKLEKAILALDVMLKKPLDEDRAIMDATIHRFEFTVELFWKLLKKIIESLGKEVGYPKEVLQEAFAGKLINDQKIWLAMLHDRNQTSHTYNEEIANEIYSHIKMYYPVIKATFDELHKKYYKSNV